ncbi:recombinase XerC [Shouchella clausii]|nr:recombinase XerC [Shouchella clausii]
MAFYRKRGNKWEYRISYIDRRTGKPKETSKGGFRTKKEAQLAAVEAESKIQHFGFAENGRETIKKYMEDWLEVYKKPYVEKITYSVQERNVRLNILPRWSHYKLKDITRTEYQKWINELRENYSEGTVRRIHSIFKSALDDAVHEFRIIRENPIQKVKIPKDKESSKEIKYFTKKQLDLFLKEVKKPQKNAKYQHSIQYFVLFSLMGRTGIRIGEALALTWDDFDSNNKTISINKTLIYPLNSQPYLSTPKTKKSKRIVKLDKVTVNLMKKHRINQKEVILRYENYKATDKNIIFHQHDGRWLRTNVVREYFKVVCKRANLPVLSPHALRHSHAVHLLEAGVNIKYVSERLGHASVKVTADTYLHVTNKIEDDALTLYENYVENRDRAKTGQTSSSNTQNPNK